jgi:hypothetical protein
MNPPASRISKEQMATAQVLVVGDVMLDRYWYGAVDRISPEAPVPVVRITREEERNGGAANVAYNVVTLGAHASLLTVVGDDEASHKLEALVAKTGIEPHFGRDADLKTTVKLRVIGRQQQLLRLDFENTPKNEILASQTAAFEPLLPSHGAVLFSGLRQRWPGPHHRHDCPRPRNSANPFWLTPKAVTFHATGTPPSSHPTGPSCSRSSVPGVMNPSCAPRCNNLREQLYCKPFC